MAQKQNASPLHVLVVCHGNRFRSPLAAAVLARELDVNGEVQSAGVGPAALKNHPAAKGVREWAAERNIDLSRHRGQPVTQELINWATHVVYMDGGNKRRLEQFDLSGAILVCLAQPIGKPRISDPAFLGSYSLEFAEVMEELVMASVLLAQMPILQQRKNPGG